MSSPPSFAFVASHLLVSSFCWATSFVFIKLMAGAIDPITLSAVRASVAALALLAFFTIAGIDVMPRGRAEFRQWLVIGTLNGWVPNITTAYAVMEIPAALAAMIQAAGPIVVAIAAHLAFAGEALDRRRALGVAIGFVGMTLLIAPAMSFDQSVSVSGVVAMIVTMLSYAACTIYIRHVRADDPNRLAFGQQSISGAVAIPLALAWAGTTGLAAIQTNLHLLVALGILSTAVPVLFWMRVLARAGPTKAAMNGYLMPVWATLLAVLVLGETVGIREIVAAAIIFAGVALVTAPRAIIRTNERPTGS